MKAGLGVRPTEILALDCLLQEPWKVEAWKVEPWKVGPHPP